MFKSIVYGILFIAVVTANAVSAVPNDIGAQVTVVNDDSELMSYKEQGIDLISLIGIQERSKFRYYIGIRMPNDHLVSQSSNSSTFSSYQDVQVMLEYPKNGEGAIVTYAEISIDQSSFNARVYLASGGIGQRSIAVFIEARHTLHFNYVAKVYGI